MNRKIEWYFFSVLALTGCNGAVSGVSDYSFDSTVQASPSPSHSSGTDNMGGVTLGDASPSPTSIPGSDDGSGVAPTPSESPTPSLTPTATATPTPTATATPTATPTAPVAQNDGPFETAENTAIAIPTSKLLLNDSDPQSLPLSFVSASAPSHGTIRVSGGTVTYTPSANYVGADSFTYQITNTAGLTASANTSINVRLPASAPMYSQSAGKLYTYDPSGNTPQLVANFNFNGSNFNSVLDIGITPTGLMYGVSGSAVYYINDSTGAMTLIPTAGIASFGNINGMTALSDGRLVIAGDGVALYDIATRTLSTLVAPGGYQSSGDIIALPDGFLYMTAAWTGHDHLIKINPSNGATQDLGSLGYDDVYGLGYQNNILYGFTASGQILQIQVNVGSTTTTLLNTTAVTWYGATTNPVLW